MRSPSIFSAGPQQHAEEVARVVRIGNNIELLEVVRAFQLLAHIAQGGEILDRKADAVE